MEGSALALIFLSGWAIGVPVEWLLHWLMHRFSLGFHIGHHREFFHLEPQVVARHTIDPRLDIWFFLGALALASPLMFWLGWAPVLCCWGGIFWHVVIVYELCHALIHYDMFAPRFFREARLYRWWKGCHFEHHFHEPARNFSVTCPWLDVLLGTYAAPRGAYTALPHPKLKPEGDAYALKPGAQGEA